MPGGSGLRFITDFADQAVILPIFASVTLILLVARRWRVALAWLVAVAGVLGVILVLKVVCYACGWLLPVLSADRLNLQSPSGHVASAAVVYAGLALLVARAGAGAGAASRMGVALALSAGVGMVIGVTRAGLGAHSPLEIAVAIVVGSAGAVLFAGLARPVDGRARWSVIAATVGAWVLFHGVHLPAEAAIRTVLGERLRQTVAPCQPDPPPARP